MPPGRPPDRPPRLFESTADLYARYRLPYLPEVFDLLEDRFGLGVSTPVLDLGCGTGELAVPLAARRVPVHAVDPEIEMISRGFQREEEAGVTGVAWQRGDDRTLTVLHLPRLRLCTMGSSFHWTDRDALLRALDVLVDGVGGVALLSSRPSSVWGDEGDLPDWAPLVRATIVDFLGPRRRAGGGTYEHPEERHEAVLARSAFPQVEQHRFERQETLTVDQIVGLQLSMSYASPAQFGPKLELFREVLARQLREEEPSGAWKTTVTSDVLLATR